MKSEREVCPFCESLGYGCHIPVALDEHGKQQWICLRVSKQNNEFADAIADLQKILEKRVNLENK